MLQSHSVRDRLDYGLYSATPLDQVNDRFCGLLVASVTYIPNIPVRVMLLAVEGGLPVRTLFGVPSDLTVTVAITR